LTPVVFRGYVSKLPAWARQALLIEERELLASSVNIAVNAVRFLYGVALGRNTDELMASVPRMKHTIRRAEIYARSEVETILSAPRQPRDRAFLMTVYACGLRLAEARHLKTTDIDRARMQLRVRKGKGGKERVLPLSNRLLKELGDYWPAQLCKVSFSRTRQRASCSRGIRPSPSSLSINGESKAEADLLC
jgi:integrase